MPPRLPQLTGQLDLTRQRYTENGAVPPPLAGSIRESGTAAAGRQLGDRLLRQEPRGARSRAGRARAAEADVEAARVLLASNVARTTSSWCA
jgi:outer membrane protein TolC